jgi:DNA-binding MarR family transcriptional regulator
MNALNLQLMEVLRPLGLSTQQFRVMQVVAAQQAVSITAISRDAIIEQSVVSRIVDQLERREFVRRRKSSGNARMVEVTLTPVGVAVLDSIRPHAQAIVADATSVLSPQDHATLLGLLARVLHHTRPPEPQGMPSDPRDAVDHRPGKVIEPAGRANTVRKKGRSSRSGGAT